MAAKTTGERTTTYGVVWREGAHQLARGKLELFPGALRLDGMIGSEPIVLELPYDGLSKVRIGRSPDDRIDGRPSLVLEPLTGDTLSIASVAQAGVLTEIADRLAGLQLDAEKPHRLAVVLPLRAGSRAAVRELIAAGPPFDPDELGLDHHQVFLTASEAVFIFEWTLRSSGLDALLNDSALWYRAGWGEHSAGLPKIAEDVFSWTRNGNRIDSSLLPPGLRNGDNLDT